MRESGGLSTTLRNVFSREKPNLGAASQLTKDVTGHALVRELSPSITMPSYVPARSFALALVEVLRSGSQGPVFSAIEQKVAQLPAGPAKQSLTAILTEAAGDLDAFKARVETWYHDSMDRLSGVYKRFTQYLAFWMGFVLAVMLNVSAIEVGRGLWIDDAVREAVVGAAERHIRQVELAQPEADAGAQEELGERLQRARQEIRDTTAALQALPLPIGWGSLPGRWEDVGNDWKDWPGYLRYPFGYGGLLISLLLGWLITGLAVSLGAPFWFDVLKTFLSIRASGPKPAGAPPPPVTATAAARPTPQAPRAA